MKTVSDIGERGLIKLASQIYKENNDSIDLDDDCAKIPIKDDYLLVTSDLISEQTHIPPEMTPWQIGWFVTAINLSDVAAKGGYPLGVLISLGLPKNYPLSSFSNLIKGASCCATQFNTAIIGGDTKENQNLVASGTALGKIKKNLLMSRKGSQLGDLVAVTGSLGKAAAGYYSLKKSKKHESNNALCEPVPRIKEGNILAKTKKVHCCMDLSDGISSSLYQLSDLNNIGFEIDQEKLPVSKRLQSQLEKENDIDRMYSLFHFGGDYELLLTSSPKDISSLQKTLQSLNTSLTVIGKVIKEKKIFLKKSKRNKYILPNRGYEHLSD